MILALAVICLFVAFSTYATSMLKSLHEIEHLLRCVYRNGAKSHANVGTEDGRDDGKEADHRS